MKACVFTLGCKLNEVESASIMRGLEEKGYEVTEELCFADLYVLNTCAVTAEAEKKSRQAVARMRKYNPSAPVIVCGCASHNHPEAFSDKEGVTLVLGAQRKDRLLSMLDEKGILPAEQESAFCELPPPKRTKTRAFIRIQDGCNRFCSYCIIPYLRGRSRSREFEKIYEEAKSVSAKEIVLTGVDSSTYRDGEKDLGDLIEGLSDIGKRVRLGSLQESVVSEEFLLKCKRAGNFVPHFHLSLQSGSNKVLRDMNRKYTREEYLEKVGMIYSVFEDAAITTDIIVGYPTEEEADFADSLRIVEEARFAQVHCFPFSPREGTVAAKCKDLPGEVKKERNARLIAKAKEEEEKYLLRHVGSVKEVLFEEDGGYTENYIRVYADGAEEGMLAKVRLSGRFRDGMKGEILEVL